VAQLDWYKEWWIDQQKIDYGIDITVCGKKMVYQIFEKESWTNTQCQ
jgi:hypothetical protein